MSSPCRTMSAVLMMGGGRSKHRLFPTPMSVTRDEAMSPIQSSAGQPRVTQPRSLCCLSSPRAALS